MNVSTIVDVDRQRKLAVPLFDELDVPRLSLFLLGICGIRSHESANTCHAILFILISIFI